MKPGETYKANTPGDVTHGRKYRLVREVPGHLNQGTVWLCVDVESGEERRWAPTHFATVLTRESQS